MKHRVRITLRALSDADETHAWMTEHLSRAYADRWYVGLFEAIEKLADHPFQVDPVR